MSDFYKLLIINKLDLTLVGSVKPTEQRLKFTTMKKATTQTAHLQFARADAYTQNCKRAVSFLLSSA